MSHDNRIMSIDELATYLSMSKSTLYKLSQEGKIPRQKIGRHWRYNREYIDEWIANEGTTLLVKETFDSVSAKSTKIDDYFTPEQMEILRTNTIVSLESLLLFLATRRGKQRLMEILTMPEEYIEEIATQIVEDQSARVIEESEVVDTPPVEPSHWTTTLKKTGRECLGGRILYAGTPVLINPTYPDQWMEDTPENRTDFKKRSHIWKDETRVTLVKNAIAELQSQGYGRPGAASIRVKTVVAKTNLEEKEVTRIFHHLSESTEYKLHQTENGMAIMPEKIS